MSVHSLTNKNTLFFGYFLVVSSLLFGSLRPLLIQYGLINQNISPVLMLSLTAIATALCALFTNKLAKLEKKHFKALIFAGTLLFLNSFAVIYALERLSVISVSIIIALTPLLIAVHVSLKKKKPLTRNFFYGFIIAFIGVLLVLNIFDNNDFTFNVVGVVLSFLAILASDFYRVTLEEVTADLSSRQASQYVLIIGGILGCLVLPFGNIDSGIIQLNMLFLLFIIGLFAFLANLFFVKAIKVSGSTKVSMIYISKPAVIALLGFLIFHIDLLAVQVAGIVLIILGLFIYELDKLQAKKSES